MALKTFNLDKEVYKKFSEYCKKEGISMSKRVEKFIRGELEKLEGKGFRKVEKAGKKIVEAEMEHSFKKYC